MSSVDKKKTLGQVFTPFWVVDTMFNELGYIGHKTLSLSILEPSVGEGVFLQEAVRRILKIAKEHNLSDNETIHILENNVVGIDIDEEIVEVCKQRLNTVLQEHGFKHNVVWDIKVGDALEYDPQRRFDLVVGNPPYISIHNMPPELRQSVKAFSSSTGSTDLYVIFFELGLRWLSNNGVLGYIAPNSWLKNHPQRSLREKLLTGKHIRKIIDYGSHPVFDDADTYTAITILSRKPNTTLTYQKMVTADSSEYIVVTDYTKSVIPASMSQPLVFNRKGIISSTDGLKLKDVCTVQNGVATLRDKVFLDYPDDVEPEMLRPVVKASRYKGEDITKSIIFPYREELRFSSDLFGSTTKKVVVPLKEKELDDYPALLSYLEENRKDLESRNLDKSASWFHYGRSQGLRNANKPKLVLSMVLSPKADKVIAYKESDDVLVYSGFFITLKENSKYSLDDIADILASPEFFEYVWNASKDMGGGYKNFSVRVVNEFIVPERFLL